MSRAEGSPAAPATFPGPIDEHCRARPAEPLRPYVAWYTGYRQRGVPPARHRGLPSAFLTLIFTLDEPLTMLAHPDPGQPPGEFGLAHLPVPCGYLDQAHRAREFRALAGCPPSQWLAEEFRNVQAGAWL